MIDWSNFDTIVNMHRSIDNVFLLFLLVLFLHQIKKKKKKKNGSVLNTTKVTNTKSDDSISDNVIKPLLAHYIYDAQSTKRLLCNL